MMIDVNKGLYWRCSENVSEELNDLIALKEKQSHGLTTIEAIKNLSKPHIRTPFIIIVMNFILSNFAGIAVMIFYAVGVFKQAGINENEHLAAIITAVVRIFGGMLGETSKKNVHISWQPANRVGGFQA